MALGRLQGAIVDNLAERSHLNTGQLEELKGTDSDLNGSEFDELLLGDYRVSLHQLNVAKAKAYGVAPFNVKGLDVNRGTWEILDQEFCNENGVVPVSCVGKYIVVAFSNPFELTISSKIAKISGKQVVTLLSPERDIKEVLNQDANSGKESQFDDVVEAVGIEFGPVEDLDDDSLDDEESAPIIQLANRIVEDAYGLGASDIHIEPQEKELVVRYRIDGVCQEKLRLPSKVAGSLIARLKIMANLDIAERRLPQDGRIIFKQFNRKNIDIDLRVATAPLNHGEGIVMRILDKQKSTMPLPAIGFAEENLLKYRESIKQPYGMILHCGPTGSGKSMTLYSALNEINSPRIVIRTAEDPIEYTLNGINQMQMNRQIGLTFASSLRAFLRQDPDIILVGEIRDTETANIAVEAALTGHLLISTLHTNDAPSTIARLTDMNIEPFMISSSLLCVCAQRLMRRVCKTCRIQYEPKGREKEVLETGINWSGTIFKYNPKGCPRCSNTGFKGRIGIHELMATNDELIEAINKGKETSEIKKIAMRGGMKTLHQDSLLKVKDGITTLPEALATVPVDMT
ncbi:GspE/PulE family protein [Candidatus Pelagisphaera phototrophica]|uniref:GspE/PulE family protein n=1 Tax=Candidatus Pelagisphaera phototrophica TaxID=2684113 RepID=UPI0019F19E57|nr:GspE/PulE family protein [Candidatus Pelagisphaera phototrophica]QXD33432.1 GspE/PulE family protein [Candidatus Pelagisphaera phototrophica]